MFLISFIITLNAEILIDYKQYKKFSSNCSLQCNIAQLFQQYAYYNSQYYFLEQMAYKFQIVETRNNCSTNITKTCIILSLDTLAFLLRENEKIEQVVQKTIFLSHKTLAQGICSYISPRQKIMHILCLSKKSLIKKTKIQTKSFPFCRRKRLKSPCIVDVYRFNNVAKFLSNALLLYIA